mmetsp:Transcript_9605/g.30857  ORF Transcript_9605/g.30857 Transcript_9605/m.30857 type:complete len:246 (-) Transcript_9605:106-843(-)|eukprot:scaffold35692_cov101-Isochrysis_galbana.AAC.3
MPQHPGADHSPVLAVTLHRAHQRRLLGRGERRRHALRLGPTHRIVRRPAARFRRVTDSDGLDGFGRKQVGAYQVEPSQSIPPQSEPEEVVLRRAEGRARGGLLPAGQVAPVEVRQQPAHLIFQSEAILLPAPARHLARERLAHSGIGRVVQPFQTERLAQQQLSQRGQTGHRQDGRRGVGGRPAVFLPRRRVSERAEWRRVCWAAAELLVRGGDVTVCAQLSEQPVRQHRHLQVRRLNLQGLASQ